MYNAKVTIERAKFCDFSAVEKRTVKGLLLLLKMTNKPLNFLTPFEVIALNENDALKLVSCLLVSFKMERKLNC